MATPYLILPVEEDKLREKQAREGWKKLRKGAEGITKRGSAVNRSGIHLLDIFYLLKKTS